MNAQYIISDSYTQHKKGQCNNTNNYMAGAVLVIVHKFAVSELQLVIKIPTHTILIRQYQSELNTVPN